MIKMAAKKKLFLIAGHGEGDPGACSIWGQEANYTRELAKMIKTAIGSRMDVTLYDIKKNCYAQSKKGNVPDYSQYDMTVEVHFNAKAKKDPYGDGSFTGVGGYIHPNNDGRSIARKIIDQVVDLGFKEWLLDTSTGLLNLNRAQAQGAKYFLLETAFIDDGDDMKFYTAHKEEVARAVAQGILNGLAIDSVAAQPKPKQYYRVRFAKDDEKSQLFAGTKAGALALCKTKPGYSVYAPNMECIYTNEQKGLQGISLQGISEADYIEKVGPLYTEDEKKTGILACISLAQSIRECGCGKTDLAQNANNMHGMKVNLSGNTWPGTTWDGTSKYTKMSPEEDENGNTFMKQSDFRCYSCIEDSIADHSAYLLNAADGKKQRYAGLKGETDYHKAAYIIKAGGYATDSKYAEALIEIIEKWDLTRFDASVAAGGSKTDTSEAAVTEPADTEPVKPEAEKEVPYMVETTCDWLWIRKGPGTKYTTTGHIGEIDGKKNPYTIVEVADGWGRLKSGIGWICLEYTRKV